MDFTDLISLATLIHLQNPSARGFIVEQAILSSIALKGLDIGANINKPMQVISFVGPKPLFRKDILGKPILYRPQKFNFECIDGIIVLIQKPNQPDQKMKLLMFPLQITLRRKSHTDSYKKFFGQYSQWIKALEEFDIIPQFVWITPVLDILIEHPNGHKWPAHQELYVPLRKVNETIWDIYTYRSRYLKPWLWIANCSGSDPLSFDNPLVISWLLSHIHTWYV